MGKFTWTKDQESYLTDLYLQKMPIKEIVQKINEYSGIQRKYGAITSKIQALGLPQLIIKPNNPNFKAIYQDYDWCYQKFVEEGMNHQEMADEANCSKRVIEKWCEEKNNINTYTRMHNKKLNDIQHNLVIGSLLGDGHIDAREKYPLFIVSHAINQKDYLFYKYNLLRDLCEMTPTEYESKTITVQEQEYHCQPFVRFNTRTYDCLIPYRQMTKIELIEQLNDYSFAIWMLDDGHCNKKGYWELCAPLDTDDERLKLKEILYNKFKINAIEQVDNRYFRFHAEDSIVITYMILNNIPNNLDIIQDKMLSKKKYFNFKGGN